MPSGITLSILCPLCASEDAWLTIVYFGGTHGVHTLPNGDPGYPGDPAEIEELSSTCGCWSEELIQEVLTGIPVETWWCDREVEKTYPRGTYKAPCRTNNRGHVCTACGGERLSEADIHILHDIHPVYTIIEELVGKWFSIGQWFADKAEAEFYAEHAPTVSDFL